MTPSLATLVCFAGIAALMLLDRERTRRTSSALLLPILWLSLGASRMVSEWLTALGYMHVDAGADAANQIMDGSPLDRNILAVMVALCFVVLIGRRARVKNILRQNPALVAYVSYCFLSISWSDFPDVGFKRWVKSLGDLAVALIILSDPEPVAALKRVLTRVGFLLVPISLLVIKFYPGIGWAYNTLVWTFSYVGVGTDKNALGVVCYIFGVASVWHVCQLLRADQSRRRSGPLLAHATFLAMTFALFHLAKSTTSMACFLMASTAIVTTTFNRKIREGMAVHFMTVGMIVGSYVTLFSSLGGSLVEGIGKDPTLTGRTGIWDLVLPLVSNPLIGTGFESFWLGPRLRELWRVYWWHPNEAHNAYIEVYLTLGWIGLGLLAWLILSGYRRVIESLRRDPEIGTLRLAYFISTLVYYFTESAIRTMSPVWMVFLLAIIAPPVYRVPEKAKAPVRPPEDCYQWGMTQEYS